MINIAVLKFTNMKRMESFSIQLPHMIFMMSNYDNCLVNHVIPKLYFSTVQCTFSMCMQENSLEGLLMAQCRHHNV